MAAGGSGRESALISSPMLIEKEISSKFKISIPDYLSLSPQNTTLTKDYKRKFSM